jgi:hypothetical protein
MVLMASQTVISKKRRGPLPTGKGTPVLVRLQPTALDRLDGWRAGEKDAPSRPEAVRRLLEKALARFKRGSTP